MKTEEQEIYIIAYNDVLERREPQFLDNPKYMRAYRFWRDIANYSEDKIEE